MSSLTGEMPYQARVPVRFPSLMSRILCRPGARATNLAATDRPRHGRVPGGSASAAPRKCVGRWTPWHRRWLAGGSGHGGWYLAWRSWDRRHSGPWIGRGVVLPAVPGLMLLALGARPANQRPARRAPAAAMAKTASVAGGDGIPGNRCSRPPDWTAGSQRRCSSAGWAHWSIRQATIPENASPASCTAYPGNPRHWPPRRPVSETVGQDCPRQTGRQQGRRGACRPAGKTRHSAARARDSTTGFFWQALHFVAARRGRKAPGWGRASRQSQTGLDRLTPLRRGHGLRRAGPYRSDRHRRPITRRAIRVGGGAIKPTPAIHHSPSSARPTAAISRSAKRPLPREYAHFVQVSGRKTSVCRHRSASSFPGFEA